MDSAAKSECVPAKRGSTSIPLLDTCCDMTVRCKAFNSSRRECKQCNGNFSSFSDFFSLHHHCHGDDVIHVSRGHVPSKSATKQYYYATPVLYGILFSSLL